MLLLVLPHQLAAASPALAVVDPSVPRCDLHQASSQRGAAVQTLHLVTEHGQSCATTCGCLRDKHENVVESALNNTIQWHILTLFRPAVPRYMWDLEYG